MNKRISNWQKLSNFPLLLACIALCFLTTACSRLQPLSDTAHDQDDVEWVINEENCKAFRMGGSLAAYQWDVGEVSLDWPEGKNIAFSPEEQTEMLTKFTDILRASLNQDGGNANVKRLNVRATITDVDLSSPTLNTLSTVLVFIPLDRGGAAVTIEAFDSESKERLAALFASYNGGLGEFTGHFSKMGHAEWAFEQAAVNFRELLVKAE